MINSHSNRIRISKISEIVLVSSFKQYISTDVRERPNYGLLYKVSGHVKYHINGKIMDFSPGMVCYFPKGSSYYIERLERGEAIRIAFDTSEDPGIEEFTALFNNHAAIGNCFYNLITMNNSSIQEFDYKVVAAVYNLLAMLSEAARMSYIGEKSQNQLSAAVDYLGGHFSDTNLNLAEVAEKNGMSPSSFRRNFNRVYGMPPVKYISILRLNSAKSMLTSTDMSIEKIALKCGFNDQFYFSKCFKENSGLTPTEYRRINQI